MLASGLGLPYDFCLFFGLFVGPPFLNPGIFLFGTDEVYGILYCLIGHLVKLHICCLSLLFTALWGEVCACFGALFCISQCHVEITACSIYIYIVYIYLFISFNQKMTPVGFESCLDKDAILFYKLVMIDEGIHHLRFQLEESIYTFWKVNDFLLVESMGLLYLPTFIHLVDIYSTCRYI